MIRSYLANQLITNIQDNLKDTIIPVLKSLIQDYVQKMTIYAPIYKHPTNNREIFIDYSLISNPKIQDNELLIIYIDGRCVQKGDENDKLDYPKYTGVLPKINKAPKGLKLQVSQFTINTFLHSLYYSNFFIFKYETGDLLAPDGALGEVKESGLMNKIVGTVNPQNLLRKSVIKHYGDHPNIIVDFAATEAPQIQLMNGEISTNIKLQLALSAREYIRQTKLLGDNLVTFAGFKTECQIKASASVTEGGKVSLKISQIKLISFKTITNQIKIIGAGIFKSRLKKVTDEHVLRNIINAVLKSFKKGINAEYKDGKEVKFPVEGVQLKDSSAKLTSDFIEFEWAVKFVGKKTFKKSLSMSHLKDLGQSHIKIGNNRSLRVRNGKKRRHLK